MDFHERGRSHVVGCRRGLNQRVACSISTGEITLKKAVELLAANAGNSNTAQN